MLNKLILALVIAIAVSLGCILLGSVLGILNVSIASVIGNFLKTYNLSLEVLAGLWHFFR